MLLTVLSFLLALGILVTIHEFGHFYIARRCGVKVHKFSVGFGKTLYSWQDRLGTEYTLAMIPLGGYVKMLDEREGDVSPEDLPFAFNQKTVWQRMAIVVAGPVANFILAILLYFILAMIGGVGVAPVIGDLPPSGIAANAGLSEGDEILSIDSSPVLTWQDVFTQLTHRIGDTGSIEVEVKLANSSLKERLSLPINQWLHDKNPPNVFDGLGLAMYLPDGSAIINTVEKGSPAYSAGLLPDDKVLQVDSVVIGGWREFVDYVKARPNQKMVIHVERQEQHIELALIPKSVERDGIDVGYMGVSSTVSLPEGMIRPITYTFPEAVVKGFSNTWDKSVSILVFIKKLVFAEVSSKNLSGSFTIAEVAGKSAKAGVTSYLTFLALLSVSLGVFNLLPIPVLDGGHLLYYVIEAVKGSPVSEAIQQAGYKLGLLTVLGVMVLAHVNDLVRIFA